MKIKVVCNYDSDYNIYRIVNDIWNIDNKYQLTYDNDYDILIIFNSYNVGNIKINKKRQLTMLMIQHMTILSVNLTTKITFKTTHKQAHMLRSKTPSRVMLLSIKRFKRPIFPLLHATT